MEKKRWNPICDSGWKRIFFMLRIMVFFFLAGLVMVPAGAYAQQKNVSGSVKDKSGQSLPGVTIVAKGTTVGTITDMDGKFTLPVPAGAQTLVFSFVGMTTLETPIGNQSVFNVVLRDENIGLEEVVVVGYGTQKKANLTGAVDQVTSEVFENRAITNVTQGLKGVMPNLNIKLLDGKYVTIININKADKNNSKYRKSNTICAKQYIIFVALVIKL